MLGAPTLPLLPVGPSPGPALVGVGAPAGASAQQLSSDPAALWPLPPQVLASQAGPAPGLPPHDAALSDLLNAWYWSGFYAGRYAALRGGPS
jgi:hypothetical protein